MIPYGRQDITDEDVKAVLEILESDWLTQGPSVPRFEEAISNKVGSKYVCAVNSATSALHLACKALGLRAGDMLWTSPITFVATANCARYCGADAGFVDIDPDTLNISVSKLADKLVSARKSGNLPKVVIPVHFTGRPCDLEGIKELSKEFSFSIIEDASHAIGAEYKSAPIGNCKYSDISVFSFHPVKIITTAEGGAALTNRDDLNEKMKLLRGHGVTRDQALMTHDAEGDWYYQQVDLGFNYRMTDLQAALGCSQLVRLDQYIKRRNELAKRYDSLLSNLPIRLPAQVEKDCLSAFHLYVISLDLSTGLNRKVVFDKLRNAGIGVNVHYIPVHTQPYYENLGFSLGDFPVSESYYKSAITLPLFPAMKEEQQDFVVNTLSEILEDQTNLT